MPLHLSVLLRGYQGLSFLMLFQFVLPGEEDFVVRLVLESFGTSQEGLAVSGGSLSYADPQ